MKLNTEHLRAGMRVAVGLSGGADSVALLLSLMARASELGIVLSAAHLHHGLRGADADKDAEFCRELAAKLGVAFYTKRVDTKAEINGESIEEAARRLRYDWFRALMREEKLDVLATAHTLDDQAETVLMKLVRGAWTEGLGGIFPVIEFAEGQVIRPLLNVRRAEIEAFLNERSQPWREDASNQDAAFTRNRVRHAILPALTEENPRVREHLAQVAELAREEEIWWQAETARLAEQLVLSGRAVRGGGRAAAGAEGLALDVTRLATLATPVLRRLLRHVAAELGVSLDFEATENLRALAGPNQTGKKLTLPQGLTATRTPRELRLTLASTPKEAAEYALPIPGVVEAFGLRFEAAGNGKPLTVRGAKPSDRVRLRYTSGPKKIKEVLERMRISAEDRAAWPVVVGAEGVVWMQGAEVEPIAGITISAVQILPK